MGERDFLWVVGGMVVSVSDDGTLGGVRWLARREQRRRMK
jgi:hypothetical protein